MCKKHTAVSYSSTESEIISLGTGLRLDGLPALELWDLIVSVLGNVPRVSDRSGQLDNNIHKRHKSQKKIDVMEDIPTLDLWDLIVFFFGNTTQNHGRTWKPVVCSDENHVQEQSQGMFNVLNNVDCVPSNFQFARQEALLYVFEDNEAVIKMTIKGRSPTMRHVSRTHRVALDWLFDRINLDPKIQIKYIDTKNQLAVF